MAAFNSFHEELGLMPDREFYEWTVFVLFGGKGFIKRKKPIVDATLMFANRVT